MSRLQRGLPGAGGATNMGASRTGAMGAANADRAGKGFDELKRIIDEELQEKK